MQNVIKISIASLLAIVLAVVYAVTFHAGSVAAQEQSDNQKQEQSSGEYVYKTQPGDSYTELARKAVQTYGIDNKVNLTQAGIVFAETNITHEAKAGELNVGQEVKISKDLVKKWVEAAQKLSEAEQKAWGYYVRFVNFNTDKVGQA